MQTLALGNFNGLYSLVYEIFRERESVCHYIYRDANRNQDNSRPQEYQRQLYAYPSRRRRGAPRAKESQRTGGNRKSTPLEADHPGTRGQILFRSTACIWHMDWLFTVHVCRPSTEPDADDVRQQKECWSAEKWTWAAKEVTAEFTKKRKLKNRLYNRKD